MLNEQMFLVEDLYDEGIAQSPTRYGYGEGLVELGKTNPRVVVMCGDLTDSTMTRDFERQFPHRFYEMGISEQNMIGAACGLSLVGKIPYAATYAAFIPGRSFDQIRISAGYNHANVKLSGAHAGISVGPDGATHQMMEDLSMMRALPDFTVIAPCDHEETRKATIAVSQMEGPVYLRFGRDKVPEITTAKTPFEIGRANLLRGGDHVAVIACGPLVYEALMAAQDLEREGISAMVINMHTIKPVDEEMIFYAAKKCGAIVTAEEHQISGGMGSAVAQTQVRLCPVPQEFVGMPDKYGESGKPRELMEKYGMSKRGIMEKVHNVMKLKKKNYSPGQSAVF